MTRIVTQAGSTCSALKLQESWRKLLLNCLFALLGVCTALVPTESKAQDRTSEPPQWLAPSNTDLQELDLYIEDARKKWGVPGLAVAIVHQDQLLLSKGYGVKREGGAEAVDRHTLFAIASNSKAFTAAALAILVDEGKLRWDDRVKDYLPWFELQDTHASNDLRVRDLLCHRSGLGTFSGDLLWYGTPYSPEEVLRRARYLQPESPFRSQFGYSNLMFLAAGEVVQKVSGKSWSAFVEERIFRPLGMSRSVTSVRDLLAMDNFATPHKTHLDRSTPIAWTNWDCMAAAGGIVSSVEDMSHWMRVQLRNGKLHGDHKLFSETNSREMWEAHTPIKVSAGASQRVPSTHFKAYGLGWFLSDYAGRKLVAHGGGYDGMYSQVIMVPEEKLGVVVLTNSMTGISEPLAMRVIDQILGVNATAKQDWAGEALPRFKWSREEFERRIQRTIRPEATGTKPSHELSAYEGKFVCPMYGEVRIKRVGEKLELHMVPNPILVADLEHLHYDTFVIRWRTETAWFAEGTAHFVADSRGRFTDLQLDVPNDDLWFYELKLKRVKGD